MFGIQLFGMFISFHVTNDDVIQLMSMFAVMVKTVLLHCTFVQQKRKLIYNKNSILYGDKTQACLVSEMWKEHVKFVELRVFLEVMYICRSKLAYSSLCVSRHIDTDKHAPPP